VYRISALLLILLDLWERGMNNLRGFDPWGGFESHPLRHFTFSKFTIAAKKKPAHLFDALAKECS
jgi:hypothetical protein